MKIRKKILLLIALTLNILSQANEEIKIHLSTITDLDSIYIGHFKNPGMTFSSDYVKQLENILSFDFNHNSSTKVIQTDPIKEALLSQIESKEIYTFEKCKSWNIPYIIKGEILDKNLFLTLVSPQQGKMKTFTKISLSGQLSKDRKQIHRLADAIYESIYGKPGIAATQILYCMKQKQDNEWISEIWCCDWDGANAKQITFENSYCVTPVCLSNHQKEDPRFLYVSYKKGQPKIYLGSSQKRLGKKLIQLRGNQLLPAISFQKDKIAFICDIAGQADLFLQEFYPDEEKITKPMQIFSYPGSTQASPTFNPDGSKIAFVSDKGGSPRIYVIPSNFNTKRPDPVLLTKKNTENTCPAWSPDGKKLAYSAKTKGIRQIWIYDFDTNEEYQLTEGTGNKENPSWAPNSTHLVFNVTQGSQTEIDVVNLHQTSILKISQGPGIKHYPTWSAHGNNGIAK